MRSLLAAHALRELAVQLAAVGRLTDPAVGRVSRFRVRCLFLDTRAVLECDLLDRVDDLFVLPFEAAADGDNRARWSSGGRRRTNASGR